LTLIFKKGLRVSFRVAAVFNTPVCKRSGS